MPHGSVSSQKTSTYNTSYKIVPQLTDIRECIIIANMVEEKLKPFCEKIMIVGSIRRERMQASKIAIVCIPITEVVEVFPDRYSQLDMFSPPPQPKKVRMRLSGFVEAVEGFGFIELGDAATGKFVKIVYDRKIAIELTMAEDYNFGFLVALRTGDAYYAKDVLAKAWYRKGFVNTEDGLRKRKECEKARSAVTGKRYGQWKLKAEINHPWKPPHFFTEESFFEFIDVAYLPPYQRFVPYGR